MATRLPQWTLAAETKEFVGPIAVTADGAPVSSFEVTVTQGTVRPTSFVPAETLEGGKGVLVGVGTPFPLRVGQIYSVWVKFTDTPEAPVEKCGTIKVY